MLCTCGSSMSPMKNPKLSVAASSTKKPKMTFSRFMPLLPARCRCLVADIEVIKLSHGTLAPRPIGSAHVFDGRVDVVATAVRRLGSESCRHDRRGPIHTHHNVGRPTSTGT